MEPSSSIAELYDYFFEEGYEAIARDPDAYPLGPVIQGIFAKYQVKQQGKWVLDVGCGTGLLKEFSSFSYYSGVDVSERMLQSAAEKGYQELIQSPIADYLPLLPDNSFDAVVCFSVSYFIDPETLEEVIQHMRRISKGFWLITFDGIPEDLAEEHLEKQGIPLFNHVGMPVEGTDERFMVEGWRSPLTKEKIQMEVVLGGLLGKK